jgi:hypothetical protein
VKFIVTLLLATGVVVGIAAASDPSAPTPRPGLQVVYDRIGASTSCADLQTEFDQAFANHQRDKARQRLDLMKIDTTYMAAANDRMRAIGCYR